MMKTTITALSCLLPSLAAAFTFASIDGGELDLSSYSGTPVLVVNTASQCAYTDQYTELQALADGYGSALVVLGVPSDDFGGQELDTADDVKDFCTINYDITFPMTDITRVKGSRAHPFYQWAAEKGIRPRWNFHKILIGPTGDIIADFPSSTRPNSPKITREIDRLIANGS